MLKINKILFITSLLFLITSCALAKDVATADTIATATIKPVYLENYFDNIKGTAVFYNPHKEKYYIYNEQLSTKRSSPCSTFKIFATYVGLMTGNIDVDNSTRKWNGTQYWYPLWNQDVDLDFAYKNSCVCYYRRVINDIGYESMKSYIDQLAYGNKDISDFAGILNTNETLLDLKGFWLESSLKISPVEQTQVLHRLFKTLEENNNSKLQNQLKHIMLTYAEDNSHSGLKIYGKTGFGRVNGENTDAWFVGMYEVDNQTIYYAIRLDDPLNTLSTSAKAKEIALNIIKNNYQKFAK